MKKNAISFFLVLLLFISLPRLWAQYGTGDSSLPSTQFDMSGFPQWTRDLRRIEIIAFGSFPFAYLFTNIFVDIYRCAAHDWDGRYAPWPVTSAGAIDKTQSERILTIGFAAGGAVLIALIDYGIVLYKRNRQEKENRNYPPGTPIIVHKPLYEESPDSDTRESSGDPAETGIP